jgi:hypothetical protein
MLSSLHLPVFIFFFNKWDFHANVCGRGDKQNALPKKFSPCYCTYIVCPPAMYIRFFSGQKPTITIMKP